MRSLTSPISSPVKNGVISFCALFVWGPEVHETSPLETGLVPGNTVHVKYEKTILCAVIQALRTLGLMERILLRSEGWSLFPT